MNSYPTLPFPAPRLLKLREVEQVLASCFPAGSRPSRSTVIGWIESGTLSGKQIGPGGNYYVFESSLQKFVTAITDEELQKVA